MLLRDSAGFSWLLSGLEMDFESFLRKVSETTEVGCSAVMGQSTTFCPDLALNLR